MRLLISGGGTGGHVYPALTVVAALGNRVEHACLYVGRANSLEARLAQRAQIRFEAIESGQVRGQAPWTVARSLWRMYRSIRRVRAVIRAFQPDVTFVTGGYVSAPVVWASAAEKIPSVIYLPDLEPGWAVRATARWATRVAVSFPEVEKFFAPGQAVTTGYPVRREFFNIDGAHARARLHLDPHARTIAIVGGSTGAHHLNQVAVTHLGELTRLGQLILLTGRNDEAWVNDQVAQTNAVRARVRVFGYLDEELPHVLGCADVVIARAGAATLGEFPALGLPAILVPGPFAGVHQKKNAQFLVQRGAALMVEDAALEAALLPTLEKLLDAPEPLKRMREQMRALAQPRAAEKIIALLESLKR